MNMSHSISFAMNAEKTISCSMPLSDIASDECRNNCLDNTSQMVRWCFNSIANSPVSNLAFNLSELSTERECTPKCRLSLNCSETSDTCIPSLERSVSGVSAESGVYCDDSPSVPDSPTLDLKKTIAFRTFIQEPVPEFQLDRSSPTELDRWVAPAMGAGCSEPVLLSTYSDGFVDTNSNDCCHHDNGDAAYSDESSSQDSGLGMDQCPTDFKVPPARLCHNTSRLDEDSQETCFPLQFSPVKWPEARTLSFSVAPLETTSVAGFSPVPVTQLVHGSICTDHDDVDSFVDIFDQDLSNFGSPAQACFSGLLHNPGTSQQPVGEGRPATRKFRSIAATCTPTSIAKRYARSRSVDVQTRPTKRSGPPQEFSAPKKFCRADQSFSDNEDDVDDAYKGADRRRRLVRCHSETDASIKFAVCRMSEQPDLIADSSKPCVLPTIRGKHQDLKSIISATLAGLVRGHYDSMVGEFQIIDSRYPYEFYGGHIKGARNIYTREGLVQEYLRNPQSAGDPSKRLILVFHCEFSSERGPSLYRFLRSQDRASNKECYPFLHYPEIYLLEGGYKVFFENFKELCQPQAYTHMLHKDFSEDLRKFRAKSKSWAGERNGSTRPGLRSNLKF